MRSLATSDRASVRAVSRAIARLEPEHGLGSCCGSCTAWEPTRRRSSLKSATRPTSRTGASRRTSPPCDRGCGPRRARCSRRSGYTDADARPGGPTVRPVLPEQAGELVVTWYGHATTLLELDGARLLIDPVFSERVSPSTRFGPKRLHPVPGGIEEIPSVDVVLISHDHYDHLDQPSVATLERTHSRLCRPPGVGSHLMAWGCPQDRITSLDWRESTQVAGMQLTCTEARHNSGRGLVDSQTLWAGWAIHSPRHSAYYSGDSGTSKPVRPHGADTGPL